MDKTNNANNLEKTVDAKRAKAESLCLEEKAALITSELGKRADGSQYYPEASVYIKNRYVGKAALCSEMTLEIITWTEEDIANKSGKKETAIYVRKPLPLIPIFYRTKLVYASETLLGDPGKIKVNAFSEKGGWLDDLELLYSKIMLDKELKKCGETLDKLEEQLRSQGA